MTPSLRKCRKKGFKTKAGTHKFMKYYELCLALIFLTIFPVQAEQIEWVAAEVQRIDRDTSKVTLRHEKIPSLNMSGMTMSFTIRDKSKLATIKVGDAVLFTVVREAGSLVVTDMKPAKDHAPQ